MRINSPAAKFGFLFRKPGEEHNRLGRKKGRWLSHYSSLILEHSINVQDETKLPKTQQIPVTRQGQDNVAVVSNFPIVIPRTHISYEIALYLAEISALAI
jgi:hypothetical protein